MRARGLLLALAVLLLAVGVLAAVLVTTQVPPPTPTPPPITRVGEIRLVVSVPRAGARRAQSDGIANAVRLAVDDVSGRVSGPDASYRVEVSVVDSSRDGTWSEAAERANAEAAAADPRVVAYIGPGTVEGAKVVAPVAAKAALAVVAPALTHPALTKRGYDDALYDATHPDGRTVVARILPPDDVAVKALLKWAKDTGRVPPTLALVDSSAYASMLGAAYRNAVRDLGLSETPPAKLAFLAGASPDALGERAAQLREVAAAGSEVLLADAFLAKAGRGADGAVAFFVGRPVEGYSGRALTFLRAYRERYGTAPDPYAIYGYEAARLAMDAVRRAGSDRAAVRDAVLSAKDVSGALGTWSIDARGDSTYSVVQRYLARALPDGRVVWFWDGEMSP